MSRAAVVLALPAPNARRGPAGRAPAVHGPVAHARRALEAGLDEVVVVVADASAAAGLPEQATVLLDEGPDPDEASALRVAADWCAYRGHDALVVALPGATVLEPERWRLLAAAAGPPVLVGTGKRGPTGLVRLDATIWSLLPLAGRAEGLWRARPELAGELSLEASPPSASETTPA